MTMVKRLPTMRETRVRSLGREVPLEEEMATHSSILAGKIPWTEEPSRLQSTRWQRVGHDWASTSILFYVICNLNDILEGGQWFPRSEDNLVKVYPKYNRGCLLRFLVTQTVESACNEGDPSSIPGSGRSPGEGNGNPLQYSCRENPMDGGDWQATVLGVAKNQTQLSYFTFLRFTIRRNQCQWWEDINPLGV